MQRKQSSEADAVSAPWDLISKLCMVLAAIPAGIIMRDWPHREDT